METVKVEVLLKNSERTSKKRKKNIFFRFALASKADTHIFDSQDISKRVSFVITYIISVVHNKLFNLVEPKLITKPLWTSKSSTEFLKKLI